MLDLIIGAPVWDRSWSLPLYAESVRANVHPGSTGMVFVIPPSDTSSREAVGRLFHDFKWVEVIRDRNPPHLRSERAEDRHMTLAIARNQILRVVHNVRPKHFLSWDTDFLVPPDTVAMLKSLRLPIVGVWSWLNRQQPKSMRFLNEGSYEEVLWQDPACQTAMAWHPMAMGRARHYPASQYLHRAQGLWPTDVTLAFQLMDARAYKAGDYGPHMDGEDLTFAYRLRQRNVPRYCCGAVQGVHLYEPSRVVPGLSRVENIDGVDTHWPVKEHEMPYPEVMCLADEVPLAASWVEPRSSIHEKLGLFPSEGVLL